MFFARPSDNGQAPFFFSLLSTLCRILELENLGPLTSLTTARSPQLTPANESTVDRTANMASWVNNKMKIEFPVVKKTHTLSHPVNGSRNRWLHQHAVCSSQAKKSITRQPRSRPFRTHNKNTAMPSNAQNVQRQWNVSLFAGPF